MFACMNIKFKKKVKYAFVLKEKQPKEEQITYAPKR